MSCRVAVAPFADIAADWLDHAVRSEADVKPVLREWRYHLPLRLYTEDAGTPLFAAVVRELVEEYFTTGFGVWVRKPGGYDVFVQTPDGLVPADRETPL